jgi:hypothetical protein
MCIILCILQIQGNTVDTQCYLLKKEHRNSEVELSPPLFNIYGEGSVPLVCKGQLLVFYFNQTWTSPLSFLYHW